MAPLLRDAQLVNGLVNFCSYRGSSLDDPAISTDDPQITGAQRDSHASGDLIAGAYRLRSVLADGGMGRVWTAESERQGGSVAVKVLGSMAEQDRQDSSARLLLEGNVEARLNHPAIVKVFEFGVTELQQPYIVMELLDGETLREAIDRTDGLTAVEAVRAVLPILGALGCAHGHGIVHRDVKPENIVLSRQEADRVRPTLIDFGLAKTNETQADLEEQGMLFGSPLYMSPEQARGDLDVDAAADLWAVGVVLYEAIAGNTPWQADHWLALRRDILRTSAPSLQGGRGVDRALWRILDRALQKDRRKRWPTSEAFADALKGWLSSRHPVGDPADVFDAPLCATATTRTSCVPTLRFADFEGGSEVRKVARLASAQPNRHAHRFRGHLVALVAAATLLIVAGLGWAKGTSDSGRPSAFSDAVFTTNAPRGR